MSNVDIAKKVVPFIAGVGASAIASDIIKNNVQYTGKLAKVNKVAVPVASFFIGSMFSEMVKKTAVSEIDDLVETGRKVKARFSKALDEIEPDITE